MIFTEVSIVFKIKDMIYKNKNITVECVDKLVTIKKNDELLRAETYSDYNEAEEEYKKVVEQVKAYINK